MWWPHKWILLLMGLLLAPSQLVALCVFEFAALLCHFVPFVQPSRILSVIAAMPLPVGQLFCITMMERFVNVRGRCELSCFQWVAKRRRWFAQIFNRHISSPSQVTTEIVFSVAQAHTDSKSVGRSCTLAAQMIEVLYVTFGCQIEATEHCVQTTRFLLDTGLDVSCAIQSIDRISSGHFLPLLPSLPVYAILFVLKQGIVSLQPLCLSLPGQACWSSSSCPVG